VNNMSGKTRGRVPGSWLSKRTAAVLISSATVLGAGGAIVANAAPPEFPNNVVVFPDRDFVTIEGYQNHIGETALVQVMRGTQVVGSAEGKVAEGDVAFEINHPGGYCWGAGTGLDVTPDIKAGDKVKITFPDGSSDDTTTADAAVDNDSTLDTATNTLTVTGHIASDVDPTQVEQRIVNPDLTELIGKRDIRAVPGGMTTAPKGGYDSNLEVKDGKFTATYIFNSRAPGAQNAEAAKTAATGGGERFMSWQVQDADGNRQGLTIAEHGELGGPGMGGCPAGPADQSAPKGTYSAARTTDPSKMQVKWTSAVPAPGAAKVTGYSVVALAPAASGTTEQVQTGKRTDASANATTIDVDPSVQGYTVEVRSLAGDRMSGAFPEAVTPPKVTATPAPGATLANVVEASSVTLASEPGVDIYYTTDGTAAFSAGLQSDGAKPYTGPIAIDARTELHWVALDRAGLDTIGQGTYAPSSTPSLPLAGPLGFLGTAGQGSVTLRWDAVPDAIDYQVDVYDESGKLLGTQPAATTARTQTVSGLSGATTYGFTVRARTATQTSEPSAKITVATPVTTDRVTISTAKWKSGDFRVAGSSTATSGTVTVYAATAAGGIGEPVGLTGPLTSAAPAAGSTYDLRLRAPIANPKQIYVKSSKGGVAGPFNVAS
jgi:hypothetical protein